jgi:hypothetical protein
MEDDRDDCIKEDYEIIATPPGTTVQDVLDGLVPLKNDN